MKTTTKIFLLVLIAAFQLKGQNLVPNPSFEDYGTLNCSWITSSTGFQNVMNDWNLPTVGTSDIYSTQLDTYCYSYCCGSTNASSHGEQMPRTGETMAGIYTYGIGCASAQPNYREYLQVQLIEPLVIGASYYGEYYVSRGEDTNYASNGLGMITSETPISITTGCVNLTSGYNPVFMETDVISDTQEWVKVSGSFIATTAAEYIIIGNFLSDADCDIEYFPDPPDDQGYYYIDDVLVRLEACITTTSSIIACPNEDIILAPPTSGDFLYWADASMPDVVLSTDSLFQVFPDTNTIYIAYTDCDTLYTTVQVENLEITPVNLGNDTLLCTSESLILDVTQANAVEYNWSTFETTPIITITNSGTYSVLVTGNCESYTDDIFVDFLDTPFFDFGPDQTLCPQEELVLSVLTPNATYLWNDGSTNPSLTITTAGTYAVTVTNACGTHEDEITIDYEEENVLQLELGNDTLLCAGTTLTLDAFDADAVSYLWSNNVTAPTLEVSSPGIYEVTVTSNCDQVSDLIEVTFLEAPMPFDLGEDTVLCPQETLVLDLPNSDYTYQWSDGSTADSLIISGTGIYSLTATNQCGIFEDDINVSVRDELVVPFPSDTTVCEDETLLLLLNIAGAEYLWQDGSTLSEFLVTEGGTYNVTVNNECESQTKEIAVTFKNCDCKTEIPNAFTPDGDNVNDYFTLLNASVQNVSVFEVYNRWGEKVFDNPSPTARWDGTYKGQPLPSDIYIYRIRFNCFDFEEEEWKGEIMLIR